MSVETLLEEAVTCADRLELDEARQHYQRVLGLEPNNVAALDGFGEMCLQLGDVNSARQVFERSVKLSPAGNAGRYMYLGQIGKGGDALRWFECGVHWLRAERDAVEHASGSRKELQEQWVASSYALATALCSVAEIYLTDSCDEANAEQKCEMLATEAVGLVQGLAEQTLAEPYQTLASLRLSQERPEEAATLLDQTLKIIQATLDTPAQPPLDFRMSTAKLLMEVGRADDALELLQALRMEEDESLELWYLLSCAALQANELELAADEITAALAFMEGGACPVDERHWLKQLRELQGDVAAAAAALSWQTMR